MEKEKALEMIRELIGQDLRFIAGQHNVTVFRDGKLNKGWPGQAVERAIGLPLNSLQRPDLGECELKVVPLIRKRDGTLRIKETMAITMLNAADVISKNFEESHLYIKLRNILVVSRIFESREENSSIVHNVVDFNLDDAQIYEQVKSDYELVRQTLISSGFDALTGKMGFLVQPRTKGSGHGSTSRAFYARTGFVSTILHLS